MAIRFERSALVPLLALAFCGASCSSGGAQQSDDGAPIRGFRLVNAYSNPTVFDLLHANAFSGEVSYIVSTTDLGITTASQFDASSASKTTTSITANALTYDDYLATPSLAPSKSYYVYVLDKASGEVSSFTGTTGENLGSVSESGTIAGYGGSSISYTINYPHDFDATSSATWPLIVSLKAANFTSSNHTLPSITFSANINWNSYDQYYFDLAAIKAKVNAFVEDSANRVDKSRVYGYGYSAGGCAVMLMANDSGSSQYHFKAVIGIGISSWLGDSSNCSNTGSVHFWLFYGENDASYGRTGTKVAYEGILANTPGRTGDLLVTEMPGLDHSNCTTPVFYSPYPYMWLLSK